MLASSNSGLAKVSFSFECQLTKVLIYQFRCIKLVTKLKELGTFDLRLLSNPLE